MTAHELKTVLPLYLELMKPRITSLVLITMAFGFILAGKGIPNIFLFFSMLIGAGATCAGASVLNHYLERDADKCMLRTKNRPIPRGLVNPNTAMLLGIMLILFGVFFLWWKVNLLTAFLSLLTSFLYVIVYTPLKRISWLNTTIGAIPGALPPVGGWAAASGEVSLGAGILFLILFAWQHPHFYSIAWMFREDYERGGFKMLPVISPQGKSTFIQINVFAILLILISLIPYVLGYAGKIYLFGALSLGIILFVSGVKLTYSRTFTDARELLQNSVIYLPAILFLILLGVKF